MAGFLSKLKAGLQKTASIFTPVSDLIKGERKVDESFWEDLEEARNNFV